MKVNFKHAILAAAVAMLGFSACSNEADKGEAALDGSGKLTVTVDFGSEGLSQSYTASTAKPGTSWTQNIKSMVLLLVDGSNMVKESRVIPTVTDAGMTQQKMVFTNIAAGTYTAYIVANYNQAGISAAWNENSAKGQNINSLLLSLVTYPNWATERVATAETSTNGYDEAGEVFLAKQTSVQVIKDQNKEHASAFQLKRAVSLFRVRINPTTNNNTVKFENAAANVRIRRAGVSVTPNGVVAPATPSANNLVYAKVFNTTPSGTGYTTGTVLDAANGQKYWKDVRIFPGGSGNVTDVTSGVNSQKFEIVVAGMAPAGYVTFEGTTLGSEKIVYWNGTVQGAIGANDILEVNCTLNTKGKEIFPEPTETGTLTIKTDLIPWGNIIPTELPM